MSSKLMILTVLGFFSGVNIYAGVNQDFQCEEPPLVERSALSSEDLKSNEIQESKLDRLDELLNRGLEILFTSYHIEEELDKLPEHDAKFDFSCLITTNRKGLSGESDFNLKNLVDAIVQAELDFRINEQVRINERLRNTEHSNRWSLAEFEKEKACIKGDFEAYELSRLTSLDRSIFDEMKVEKIITRTKGCYKQITHVSIKKEGKLIVIRNDDNTAILATGLTFSQAIMNLISTRTHI